MQAVMAVRSWLVGHTSNENTYFPGVSQTYKGLTKSGVALYKRVKFKPPFSAKNRGSHYTRDRICTRLNTVHVCNISESSAKSYCGTTYNDSLCVVTKAVFHILLQIIQIIHMTVWI